MLSSLVLFINNKRLNESIFLTKLSLKTKIKMEKINIRQTSICHKAAEQFNFVWVF